MFGYLRAFEEKDRVGIFSDEDMISDWALESVKPCHKIGIVKGIGGGKINPKGYTTKKQAILIIKRTYVNFLKENTYEE